MDLIIVLSESDCVYCPSCRGVLFNRLGLVEGGLRLLSLWKAVPFFRLRVTPGSILNIR